MQNDVTVAWYHNTQGIHSITRRPTKAGKNSLFSVG
ncbi:Uncharacterised protein [Bordetella pertussis]|nr:Uncharacterised protein [Bordetella pertussis]